MGISLHGIGASPGLATGKVLWWRKTIQNHHPVEILPEKVESEITRLVNAVITAEHQIEVIRLETQKNVGESEAAVFDAHIAFLQDPAYIGEMKARIRDLHQSAVHICQSVTGEMSDMLKSLPDEYLSARADDIRDIGNRLIHILAPSEVSEVFNLQSIEQNTILVAQELTPSETAQLTEHIVGLITQHGSRTGHTAIIARTLGIPLVMGIGESVNELVDGDLVIVDGEVGKVTTHPSEEEIEETHTKVRIATERRQDAKLTVSKPSFTKDGKRIEVFANIGSLKDVPVALENGAEGVGLFRTEFLYQEKDHWPTEEEQFEVYRQVLQAFDDKPVIIRTLDIGGDKGLSYAKMHRENNPFLGERAIRFCLANPDIFRTQIRALLRASIYGKLWVMLPMVENVEEVLEAKEMIEASRQELVSEGISVRNFPIGIMVEVPAAAVMADILVKYVDFMSIGTNDLTQYTLAADRGNEHVAHLYDSTHPAILRLIRQTCLAAIDAGIPVGICGELAGDLEMIGTLIGLGITELSMSSVRIPEVKAHIREIQVDVVTGFAQGALLQRGPQQVRSFIQSKTPNRN